MPSSSSSAASTVRAHSRARSQQPAAARSARRSYCAPITAVPSTTLRPLTEYFTLVEWDQRGAGGKAADPALIEPMTYEQMVDDTIELIELLRAEFEQDKVILVGHSSGSMLGLGVAKKRPDLLHAYVGVGQALSWPGGFDEDAPPRHRSRARRERLARRSSTSKRVAARKASGGGHRRLPGTHRHDSGPAEALRHLAPRVEEWRLPSRAISRWKSCSHRRSRSSTASTCWDFQRRSESADDRSARSRPAPRLRQPLRGTDLHLPGGSRLADADDARPSVVRKR